MKRITIGILAHVDSGKTTLSESLLYETGKIKKLGRVDHKDAYLDTFRLERERGITIFSKQAVLEYRDMQMTLLDTPGHVDFSAEMERTLAVLDYAILVISASEGIQGHTETLWKLLKRYQIPTFIFVNKMDMPNISGDFILHDLKDRLSENIVRFPIGVDTMEDIAMCDEDVLESYMETGEIGRETISKLIYNRQLFPCFFGSALRLEGTGDLMEGLYDYVYESVYNQKFGAKVFKITKDDNGNRLTHMKITGGGLKVKDVIEQSTETAQWKEKINEIRIYSGNKYEAVGSVEAGQICAVLGLNSTYSGQGLGCEYESEEPSLIPVLGYKIIIPKEININLAYKKLKELEEEDPTLRLSWNEETKEITANVMGPIQIEVLKHIIKERFSFDVEFGAGKILYKETIVDMVEGVGHFEPLRHYAEVHLLLEPGEPGSGITFESKVNDSFLSKNWQRLIMTHIAEKQHRGVLIGAPITDIHISLIAGKAHLKHTEGGDFRQATYRAIRQGLKKAESVLLEPYYDFVLTIPNNCVGRAMTDISQMEGSLNAPETDGEISIITGYAPVSTLHGYINDINEYTHGLGNLTLKYKGYAPCHNQEDVISQKDYDSELDFNNPTGSVFCANGAGFNVPWDEVENYMHLQTDMKDNSSYDISNENVVVNRTSKFEDSYAGDKELMAIFEKTFGPIKRRRASEKKIKTYHPENKQYRSKNKNMNLKECLLVDGYNIIFAWDDLKKIADVNIDAARDKLIDMLSNYQGYKDNTVICVFDAYNVKRHKETIYKNNNIYVVFTKEAETADMYIAKTTHMIASKYKVTVATSDALEQLIIMGHGALRMSAANFLEEYKSVEKSINDKINKESRLENYVLK